MPVDKVDNELNYKLKEYASILKDEGITARDIASKLGYSEGLVSKYIKLKQAVSDKFWRKFLDEYGGKVLSIDEKAIGKNLPLAAEPSAKYKTAADTKPVPYLKDIDAIAGVNGAAMDVSEFIDEFISVPFFSKASYYVNVRGSSMFPRYTPGDVIAIKQVVDKSEIQFGAVYVVITHENRVIKYVRKGSTAKHLLLVSANVEYDPYEVEKDKVVSMFLVLGKITKEVL